MKQHLREHQIEFVVNMDNSHAVSMAGGQVSPKHPSQAPPFFSPAPRLFIYPHINPEYSAITYMAQNDDPEIPRGIKEALPLLRKVVQVLNRKEAERIRATWAKVVNEKCS